ncbi:phosphoadenosine phosphosulfate reductase [Reticulibacter mediterranei]|uniref:Phosphoadenosine phosphosulfate reductase n=1 Tax=Reticulibacter mediterranei TaxID=2778369 RepID=A0A8J3IZN2_9CHLR|nr:phosphoadenosine phosphosulfate reductase family protein [Reticulibacter mediterranei]GHP00925.1 phosphoadenosine phosphosulfate reductase [Reticulibacter mediterranei]
MKKGAKLYLQQNVLEAAQERIALLFDRFEQIDVAVSGGKDSTVLADLCRKEALRRGRTIGLFFLDQEAEYQSTIDQIRYLMTLKGIVPYWYQVPLYMTNAVSLEVDFLYAWGPEEPWMREKDSLAIHTIEQNYPQRFYPFIAWREKQWKKGQICSVVGLRAEESLNRFRTMMKHPGLYHEGEPLYWTSSGHTTKAYPLFDWTFEDVWHYIAEENLRYNRVYDFMHWRGHRIQNVRVSYLGHENSFKCLPDLHAFEPETYRKLLERMPGIHVAARYANESMIFQAKRLPPGFSSWRAYRDFLLDTTPSQHVEQFRARFVRQGNDEEICRQQCRQLMINDWESNAPVVKPKQKKNEDTFSKWKAIL